MEKQTLDELTASKKSRLWMKDLTHTESLTVTRKLTTQRGQMDGHGGILAPHLQDYRVKGG